MYVAKAVTMTMVGGYTFQATLAPLGCPPGLWGDHSIGGGPPPSRAVDGGGVAEGVQYCVM